MSSSDQSDSATTPTPTLRNLSPSMVPPPTQQSQSSDTETRGRIGNTAAALASQTSQQGLGKGRPGVSASTATTSSSPHRPTPLHTASSPSTTFRPSLHPISPRRQGSFSSTEDEEDTRLRPRTSYMMSGETTPRVGGSQRGVPATALGSSFGSPAGYHPQSMSGSVPRQPRSQRNPPSAFPSSQAVQPGGSMSRSASRARPALQSHNSTGAISGTIKSKKGADEDDEVEVEDRGQALIRKRQKERKQMRRAKEKERERRMAGQDESLAPPTGQNDEPFSVQQARGMGSRSVSRTRVPSVGRDGRQASEGYFGGSVAGTETPAGQSPRDERRAPSIYSSTADEDDESIAQDRAPSIINEVVAEVLDEDAEAHGTDEEDVNEDEDEESSEGAEVTLRDRQDAINIEHPFGLPIWKPALYRKSRSVTRNAESALHSIPSAAAQRHLLPGNILWVIVFGWWLTLACLAVALLVSGAEVLGGGRGGYGKTVRGLAWYIGWPFGKYVEGEGAPDEEETDDSEDETEYGATDESPSRSRRKQRQYSDGASSGVTIRDTLRRESIGQQSVPEEHAPASSASRREPTVSFAASVKGKSRSPDEREPLLGKKPIGAFRRPRNKRAKVLGRIVYWPLFVCFIAPLMLFVCVLCWGMVITIPMAKLTWALLELLAFRPLEINFRSAPKVSVPVPHDSPGSGNDSGDTTLAETSDSPSGFTMRRARLTAGQIAPTSGPASTVLLCTYRAIGLQYYKYTVGGVNIIFINLLPLVFFTIIDGMLILPAVERAHEHGRHVSPLLTALTSQALIFVLGLASVIPLSYFIGMAVASISAQSSIGMGAVINATFGSIIEIVLYSIALIQGKGRLVEGSIVGSILAGVLLMPGASMCSGALKRKEQKFNAKSAGVTSTMLIMAIIGTLTPTMFYQTYGSFELHCDGCPDRTSPQDAWQCNSCYYEHPDPVSDAFYQGSVKTMMYACAGILLFSYLIGLWFSLRTHAAQIWQNPQQLMKADEHPGAAPGLHPSLRATMIQRATPQAVMQHVLPFHKDRQHGGTATGMNSPMLSNAPSQAGTLRSQAPKTAPLPKDDDGKLRVSSGNYNLPPGYTPFLESVDNNLKQQQSGVAPMQLPSALTTEDFTRAVAVATVSALRHQGSIIHSQQGSVRKDRAPVHAPKGEEEEEAGGGHDAPSWTRGVSAGVLLSCTLLYALIAEILVDVVDVVLQGSGIDEKFLGLTLFALVPNTTEFMNAMSFAMNGNIALSMEIGSAYALQVCLLQIPAMVAFSALYDPGKMGEQVDTFTLIFPRWDVIAIILSIFLLTYTYIEARSNYHRGSILVLAYIVLVMGFYYAPIRGQGDIDTDMPFALNVDSASASASASVVYDAKDAVPGLMAGLTKLWT